MSRATCCLSLFVVLAGCGGPGSFEGTVNGLTLSVKDSTFIAQKNGGQLFGLVLLMSDQTGLCDRLKAGMNFKSSSVFVATFGESSGGNLAAPTAGEYRVWDGSSSPGKFTFTGLAKTDGSCQTTASATASSGTVTLNGYKAEAGGTMTGSFDLTFAPDGDKGKGSFDADFCEASGVSATCS